MKCQHRIRQSAERLLVGGMPRTPSQKSHKERRNITMRKQNRTITIRCTYDEYGRIHRKALAEERERKEAHGIHMG